MYKINKPRTLTNITLLLFVIAVAETVGARLRD